MKINKLLISILVILGLFGTSSVAVASTISDKEIKQKIEKTAADTIRLRGAKVDIAVEKGFVVLSGKVDLYIQKMLYDQIAWKTEGVIEVDNEIRVVPILPQTDADIERKIMKVIRTYDRFQKITIIPEVNKGAVNIRITLNHPADVLFLKRRVAEIDGVVSIAIQAKFIA